MQLITSASVEDIKKMFCISAKLKCAVCGSSCTGDILKSDTGCVIPLCPKCKKSVCDADSFILSPASDLKLSWHVDDEHDPYYEYPKPT